MGDGYGCDCWSISAVYHSHLPFSEHQGVQAATASRGASAAYLFNRFSGCCGQRIRAGGVKERRRAQFGVAPHLSTNFRVSRTPNRRTALPWKLLTAKSTVHNLKGAPNNQSSQHRADYSSSFPTWNI